MLEDNAGVHGALAAHGWATEVLASMEAVWWCDGWSRNNGIESLEVQAHCCGMEMLEVAASVADLCLRAFGGCMVPLVQGRTCAAVGQVEAVVCHTGGWAGGCDGGGH